MSWYAIEIRPASQQRDAVAAWLVERTGQAIEERADGTLVSFALDLPAAESLEAALSAAYGPVPSAHRPLAEVDWTTAWREGLGVRKVGRFAIVPSWIPYQPAEGEEHIVLDPEMAFGSGEHGSTRGALTLVERWMVPGARVLDLGSGSAILAIAAARLGASHAIGVELDPEAMSAAQDNVARNGEAHRVTLMEGDAALLTPLLAPAGLIVSNILRHVNTRLLPLIRAALLPEGRAIFAGMETPEAEEFRVSLADAGFVVLAETTDDGWWSVATRPA